MGFAFDEATGLPAIAEPKATEPPLSPPASTLQSYPISRTEVEIGDIMLKVQRFADETAEEATRQARAVVADAQVEAASIVARAHREAEEVTASAVPQISPEAVVNLCSAIEGFAETNRVLVEELSRLRDALTGSNSATTANDHGYLSALPPTAS